MLVEEHLPAPVKPPALGQSRAPREADGARAPRSGVLWVPDWPVAAAIAEGELPAHLPAALCNGRGLTAVSAGARRLGLRPGMTRRSAQSLAPDLVLADDDPVREARAFEPVMQAIQEVVAHLVLLRPGLVLLGGGAARYHGGEHEVADALVGAAAQTGAEAHVGIATGFLTAILAARESLILPPERSFPFLTPHPVSALLHAATTRAARAEYSRLIDLWRRLGLTTLGAVAQLPAADVAARFGQVGLQAHRLAHGQDIQLRAGTRQEGDLAAGVDLDPPAERIDTAAFAARGVAAELHDLLLRRGLACEQLRICARAENGAELSRSWRLDGLLSVEELTDRVRWQLAGWLEGRSGQAPSAALVRIDLIAEGNYPAGSAQRGLWGARSRDQAEATRAATRVQSMLGAEGVLTPVAQGGRGPREQIRYVAWGDERLPARDPSPPWPGRLPSPLPTTVFAQQIPVELTGAEGQVRMTSRGGLNHSPERLQLDRRSHPVQAWAGPWPMGGRWWEGEVPEVYLQVVSTAGALLISGGRRGWHVEGAYD